MGKKKKGGGAEKTAAKTDKKIAQKMKKHLELTGEDEISAIVAQIEKEEQKKLQVLEKKISSPPTCRAYFTLSPHPLKDELILFGGEYYNGKETEVYNDLFIYKIAKDEWRVVRSPGGPAPRSGHQSVSLASNKGEIWVFGGEFTTKNESQFHHYNDLWNLNLDTYKWEKIVSPGGPSSRSGHRMVNIKKQLLLFGGYHDNLQDYKYFNDLYIFNLDTRTWNKIVPTGVGPCERSACQMVVTPEGKVLIWGGYSKVKLKKDIEQGQVHKDMFLLSPERGDTSGLKWKWSQVRAGGVRPVPLSGVALAHFGSRVYTFGGAADTETEEDISAMFYNQLHSLDLNNNMWNEVILTGKKDVTKSKRRRKEKENEDNLEMETEEGAESISDIENDSIKEEVVADDGIFVLKVGGSGASGSETKTNIGEVSTSPEHPHPRINSGMVIKSSKLYMYGGIFENKNVVYTLSDFHVLDLQKLDEWKVIIPCDLALQEWFESESSSESSEDSDQSGEEAEGEVEEEN